MQVGIICEGSTDFEVLKAIAAEVLASHEPTFSLLQPPFDRLERIADIRKAAGGWQAIRSYLRAGRLQRAVALDLVIVQVDASIRHLSEVARDLEDDALETLCDHVKGWIGEPIPESVVITLPCEEIETWLVATHTRRKDVEAIDDPAGVLVGQGLLGTRDGRPDKRSADYSRLSESLQRRLGDRKLLCMVPELDRLCSKLRARARGRRG